VKPRVLVVDDDSALAEMLGIVLRADGFDPAFVPDGNRAITAFRDSKPDIVLLDLMLPGLSGLDVCRAIRAESGIPIIMLTAKSDTVDIVLGLESGADDYVVKPFKPKELVARMRARLRHHDDIASESLTIGPPESPVSIDVPGHQVRRNGSAIALTPLEQSTRRGNADSNGKSYMSNTPLTIRLTITNRPNGFPAPYIRRPLRNRCQRSATNAPTAIIPL